MLRIVIATMLLGLGSWPAAAQQLAEDPVETSRIRIGVLGVTPRFRITNVGIDTNVFNTVTNPQSDFVMGIAPGAEFALRTGRGVLVASGDFEWAYFHNFASERAFNTRAQARYELRFNRFRPFVSGATANLKERPGYEIDVRARRYETDLRTGADFRIASKSAVQIELRHLGYRFEGAAVFDGHALNEELNRTLKGVTISWRQQLTALTTWTTRVSRESERFEFVSARNGDSFRVLTGFDLGRFALIRGSAFVGYRRLTAADGGLLPGFSGIIADTDVSYTAPSQTRLSVSVDRDIQYSYSREAPYYVQTAWNVTATQRVIGRWDAQLTGGRDRLSYSIIEFVPGISPRDFVGRFGGGVGYALNDRTRMSFDVIKYNRSSDISGREYGTLRAGVSVTYGY